MTRLNHDLDRPQLSWRHLWCAAALLGAGMFIGSHVTTPTTANGQVITTPQPQHMLSGGQLSVPILQDISATLQDIDARLARMEIVAQKMSAQRGN